MKIRVLIIFVFLCLHAKAQFTENFSDGNFTENPVWTGETQNFIVNTSNQLQSCATSASTSWLFTSSEAINDAVWECKIMINYTTSSSNYSSVYIISDVSDLTNGCNGYFVQIGGTNDEVSLFLQQGTTKTKIIDGTDKRVDGKPVDVIFRVERDSVGNFTLYSKLSSETEFFKEGTVNNDKVTTSKYFGLVYVNTSTTGSYYSFDDINVSGNKANDRTPPVWKSLSMLIPDKLALTFSEEIDITNANFSVNAELGNVSAYLSEDKTEVILDFESSFQKGTVYSLSVDNIYDLSGNWMKAETKKIAITENAVIGDLYWNEIMFENPESSYEYVEIINTSEKVIDITDFVFTTRKSDGSLNTGQKIPKNVMIAPNECIAFTENPEIVRSYHLCPENACIVETEWTNLNNETATLVLTNPTKDTIYDELTYNSNWHHPMIKNPKGVALEKINPLLETQNSDSWHSAGSDNNYGTPGFKNSQFLDLSSLNLAEKQVWIEPEAFSPDNDGNDDICFIRYHNNLNGYIANIQVLNPVGEKVFQVANNKLLSTDGVIMWDGRTDKGKIANPGIYVVYIEIFNPLNGSKKISKLPLVLTSGIF